MESILPLNPAALKRMGARPSAGLARARASCGSQLRQLRVLAVMDRLPAPLVKEVVQLTASANGAISVRLPRSVHAALLAEAKAEGVSLNQLCLSKLVAQLRAVI